jgi:hypothetical protein
MISHWIVVVVSVVSIVVVTVVVVVVAVLPVVFVFLEMVVVVAVVDVVVVGPSPTSTEDGACSDSIVPAVVSWWEFGCCELGFVAMAPGASTTQRLFRPAG